MPKYEPANIGSQAVIAGYPVHLWLIPLPVICLAGLLVTDLIFLTTGAVFWSKVSMGLGVSGLLAGFIASAFGLLDFATTERFREQEAGWMHALSATAVLVLTGLNLYVRAIDPASGVLPWGLALSALTVSLLGVTTWHGAALSRSGSPGADRLVFGLPS